MTFFVDGATANGSQRRRNENISSCSVAEDFEMLNPSPPTERPEQRTDRTVTKRRCLKFSVSLLLILKIFSLQKVPGSSEAVFRLSSYHTGSLFSLQLETEDDTVKAASVPRIKAAKISATPPSLLSSQLEAGNYTVKATRIPRIKEATNNETRYYYLHIPKTAGYSMERMLSHHGVQVKSLGVGKRMGLLYFDQWVRKNPESRVFMTEHGFNAIQPPHSLVTFRDPNSHVISQYFHCKESKSHKVRNRHKFMPDTLLEWLQGWKTILEQQPSQIRDIWNFTHQPYKCYSPVNPQSWFASYPESKTDLKNLFDAVGIVEQLEKSHCVFLVQILKEVPQACNCSGNKEAADQIRHFKLDHGVKHHGSSYEPSEEERRLIQELTFLDQKLYQVAKSLFEEQVKEIESKYNLSLCGKFYT